LRQVLPCQTCWQFLDTSAFHWQIAPPWGAPRTHPSTRQLT
jgi:hypothetical protein